MGHASAVLVLLTDCAQVHPLALLMSKPAMLFVASHTVKLSLFVAVRSYGVPKTYRRLVRPAVPASAAASTCSLYSCVCSDLRPEASTPGRLQRRVRLSSLTDSRTACLGCAV